MTGRTLTATVFRIIRFIRFCWVRHGDDIGLIDLLNCVQSAGDGIMAGGAGVMDHVIAVADVHAKARSRVTVSIDVT